MHTRCICSDRQKTVNEKTFDAQTQPRTGKHYQHTSPTSNDNTATRVLTNRGRFEPAGSAKPVRFHAQWFGSQHGLQQALELLTGRVASAAAEHDGLDQTTVELVHVAVAHFTKLLTGNLQQRFSIERNQQQSTHRASIARTLRRVAL